MQSGDVRRNESERVLFLEGTKTYVDALVAIREFRKLIYEKSKDVLERRLIDISECVALKGSKKDIGSYFEPNSIPPTYDGWGAWITAKIDLSFGIYCGLSIRRDYDTESRFATVMFDVPSTNERYEQLCELCDSIENSKGIKSIHDYKREILLCAEYNDLEGFVKKLDKLIDCWVEVFKKYRKEK